MKIIELSCGFLFTIGFAQTNPRFIFHPVAFWTCQTKCLGELDDICG